MKLGSLSAVWGTLLHTRHPPWRGSLHSTSRWLQMNPTGIKSVYPWATCQKLPRIGYILDPLFVSPADASKDQWRITCRPLSENTCTLCDHRGVPIWVTWAAIG